MALQTSRFQGQEVVNSFNIFIDTEKSSLVGDRTSQGDDVKIHFEGLNYHFIPLNTTSLRMFSAYFSTT